MEMTRLSTMTDMRQNEFPELNSNLGLPRGQKKIRENLPWGLTRGQLSWPKGKKKTETNRSDWKSDPLPLTCPVSDFQIREARNLSDFNSERKKTCHEGCLLVGSFGRKEILGKTDQILTGNQIPCRSLGPLRFRQGPRARVWFDDRLLPQKEPNYGDRAMGWVKNPMANANRLECKLVVSGELTEKVAVV